MINTTHLIQTTTFRVRETTVDPVQPSHDGFYLFEQAPGDYKGDEVGLDCDCEMVILVLDSGGLPL